MESVPLAGSQAPHVRIPGVTAMLHTNTAVMFTSRLRGVKTCNLYTGAVRARGRSNKSGSSQPL